MILPYSISGQDWFVEPSLRRIFDILGGPEDVSRIVGGAVRNALLQKPVTDIDFATKLTTKEVTSRLTTAGVTVIPTGIKHGTVTACIKGQSFEITTLRSDIATDGRYASVIFIDDWTVDAARRDFTINALYANDKGLVSDPTGLGFADLKAGRICFIGNPEQRIAEDYLRILRFFRFYAWYGKEEPDIEVCAAIRKAIPQISKLAPERIATELLSLMKAKNPSTAVSKMEQLCALQIIYPALGCAKTLARLITLEPPLPPQGLRRLAALLPDATAGEACANHLHLSTSEKQKLTLILSLAAEAPYWKKLPLYPLHRHGQRIVEDGYLIACARGTVSSTTMRTEITNWIPKPFPLRGEDVLATSIPPGPTVGLLLRGLETWWLAAGRTASREHCLEELDRRAKAIYVPFPGANK